MNALQREAWQRAEDHTWRAMYVVTVNVTFLAVTAIFGYMAGQISARQIALGAPIAVVYGLLAWGVGRRQSRIAGVLLVALAAVPLGARIHQHSWVSAVISALFLAVYGLALHGTIVLHQLRGLDLSELPAVRR